MSFYTVIQYLYREYYTTVADSYNIFTSFIMIVMAVTVEILYNYFITATLYTVL